MAIELYNPNDNPFGKLSNSSYFPLKINGKIYDSVTNYIYSNTLSTPTYRDIIRKAKIKGINKSNSELLEAIDYLTKENTEKPYEIKTKKQTRKLRTPSKFKPLEEEDIQEAFDISEELNKKDYITKSQYEKKISDKLNRSIENVDLYKLKKQLLDESLENQADIYKLYNNKKNEELFNIIVESLRKGYESKFKTQELKTLLLKTDNRPIQYQTSDTFLGINEKGIGNNLVGKIIIQIRNNTRINENIEKEKKIYKNIYDIYLAYIILQTEMIVNKKQLTEYLEMTPVKIIDKYNINKLKNVQTYENIIQLYKNNKLDDIIIKEISQPGTLVINVTKNNIKNLKYQLEMDKKDIIFNLYLKYIINQNYEKEINHEFTLYNKTGMSIDSINKIKSNIIDMIIAKRTKELTTEAKNILQDKIVELFELNMLPTILSNSINDEIKLLKIPTDDEIKNSEKENSEGSVNQNAEQELKTEKENLFMGLNGNPIFINKNNSDKFSFLNPEYYTGMLSIDGRYYPTIQHYMIVCLISNTGIKRNTKTKVKIDDSLYLEKFLKYKLSKVDFDNNVTFEKGMGIDEARKNILTNPKNDGLNPSDFFPIEYSARVYDKIEENTQKFLLSINSITAITKKFEDTSLQDLLLLTGDSEIKWLDPYDFYLGSVNDGNNYVGHIMSEIRKNISSNRQVKKEVDVKVENLIDFSKDLFLFTWIQMRLRDMCNVVYKLQEYIRVKYDIDIDLTEEAMMYKLVNNTLNTIYQSEILFDDKPNIPVPIFFQSMVSKCKGLKSGVQDVHKTDNKGNSMYNNQIQKKILENQILIDQLNSNFWGSKTNHSKEDIDMFNKKQLDEWVKFRSDLNNSQFSKEKKNKMMDKMKQKRLEDYNLFWNILETKKTQEEISYHELSIKDIKKELLTYIQQQEKNEKKYFSIEKNIAQIYWNRIVAMLATIIQNIKKPTLNIIKNILIKCMELNSEKVSCIRIINNERDNCILVALLNLLTSINKIKYIFVDNQKVELDDIYLASSIILNTKFQPKNDENVSDNEDDEKDEKYEEDEIFLSEVKPSNLEDDEVKPSNLEDDFENDPYFSFGTPNLNKIKKYFISKKLDVSNIDELYDVIMKNVKHIKKFKMSEKIKQNRINYFASSI